LFTDILNEKSLIEYIHIVEGILFDEPDDDETDILGADESKAFEFTQKQIQNLIPEIVKKIIGEDRFKGGINVLLKSMTIPILNK
jgi:hypothetical protein